MASLGCRYGRWEGVLGGSGFECFYGDPLSWLCAFFCSVDSLLAQSAFACAFLLSFGYGGRRDSVVVFWRSWSGSRGWEFGGAHDCGEFCDGKHICFDDEGFHGSVEGGGEEA